MGYALTVAVAFCLAGGAKAARADVPGVYARTQNVDNGAIRYTLTLNTNGTAELKSERRKITLVFSASARP